MSNTLISFIRSYVPIIVGALVSWLLARGLVIDEETQNGLTVALTGIIIALYYAIARLLERKWSFFGFLLGTTQQPVYQSVHTQAQIDKTA